MTTSYRVLRKANLPGREGLADAFVVVADGVEGNSAQAAIRKAVTGIEIDGNGEVFVAVPASNWTEEPVAVFTPEPRVRVGVVPGQTSIDEGLEDS